MYQTHVREGIMSKLPTACSIRNPMQPEQQRRGDGLVGMCSTVWFRMACQQFHSSQDEHSVWHLVRAGQSQPLLHMSFWFWLFWLFWLLVTAGGLSPENTCTGRTLSGRCDCAITEPRSEHPLPNLSVPLSLSVCACWPLPARKIQAACTFRCFQVFLRLPSHQPGCANGLGLSFFWQGAA